MGATSGTTTIQNDLVLPKDLTVGTTLADNIVFNGSLNCDTNDILIRGTDGDPMRVGRGTGGVNTNIAFNCRAIQSVSSGSQNTAVGFEALFTTNTSASNTAYGNRFLRANGVGSDNIAIGKDALLTALSGDKNLAIGNNALRVFRLVMLTSVLDRHYAGYGLTGGATGNVIIGPADDANSTNATYLPPNGMQAIDNLLLVLVLKHGSEVIVTSR